MARKPDSTGDGKPRVPTTRSSSSFPDEEHGRHPFRKLLRFLIVVAVLAITAYCILFYRSFSRAQGESEQVIAEYDALKRQIVSGDVESANEKASEIANMSNRLKAQANNWSWEVATHIPVLGTNVDAARTFINVNALMGNHLAEPITLGYGDLLTADAAARTDEAAGAVPSTSNGQTTTTPTSDGSPFASSSVNEEAAELLTAIETAQPIVIQCRATVNALSPPLFPKTRDLVTRQQETLETLYPIYDDAEVILETGSSLGETVTGFLPY